MQENNTRFTHRFDWDQKKIFTDKYFTKWENANMRVRSYVLWRVKWTLQLYLPSVWPCSAAPVNKNLLHGSIRSVQCGVGCCRGLQQFYGSLVSEDVWTGWHKSVSFNRSNLLLLCSKRWKSHSSLSSGDPWPALKIVLICFTTSFY
jgi:hypothetical protein